MCQTCYKNFLQQYNESDAHVFLFFFLTFLQACIQFMTVHVRVDAQLIFSSFHILTVNVGHIHFR